MSGPTPSEQQQLLMAGYVLNQLDNEEMAAFAEQIQADPALMQEVHRLQQALEDGFAPPLVEPPPHLRAAILSRVQPQPESPHVDIQSGTRLSRWGRGIAAIAAVVIAGLTVSNVVLWRSLQTMRLAADSQATLQIALEPTDAAQTAQAVVLVDPNSLQATLTVENMPPLPPGQVYVLWTVLEADAAFTTDAKNAILTEVFTVDDQGQQSREIVVPQAFRDPSLVAAVAITIEDAAAPQRHESAPILIERL